MGFHDKAKVFIYQLSTCLGVDPEPCIITPDDKILGLLLEPEKFLSLIRNFEIQYPFIFENEIINLTSLVKRDQIDPDRAIEILKNLKDFYWLGKNVDLFEDVVSNIKTTLKKHNKNISANETNLAINQYQEHLNKQRAVIFSKLIVSINNLKNDDNIFGEPIQTTGRTKELIENKINQIDKNGWEYFFLHREDYEVVLSLLTSFFEQKEYRLPTSTIKLRRSSKTKIAKVLKSIHQDLSDEPLISDTEFLSIVRSMNHFKNDDNLYNTLTK